MKFYARANGACHGNRVKHSFDRNVTFVNQRRHMEISREIASSRCLKGNPWKVIFVGDLLRKGEDTICNNGRDRMNVSGKMLETFDSSFHVGRVMFHHGLT